jgi:hypothetical protein
MISAKTEIAVRLCAKEKNTNNTSEVAIAERDKSRIKMKKEAQTVSENRRTSRMVGKISPRVKLFRLAE